MQFKKLHVPFFSFLLVVCAVVLNGYFTKITTHSQRFGDETAHFAGGHLILENNVLYKNIQSNHQPLNYYFSALVEKATHPSNLFLYIARERQALFLYSTIWNFIFLLIGGPILSIFVIFFEITKFWLSGYKLLGETLAIYPFTFIAMITFQRLFLNKKPNNLTVLLYGLSLFLVVFSLVPLWPPVFLLTGAFVFYERKDLRKIALLLVPFLVGSILLFLTFPIQSWFKETIYYNLKYFIPFGIGPQSNTQLTLLFFLPFLSFTSLNDDIAKSIALFTINLITSVATTIKSRKIFVWIFFIFILIISNPRVNDLNFSSFHLLPWFGLLVLLSTIVPLPKKIKLVQFSAYGIFLIYLIMYSNFPFRSHQANLIEYDINYARTETIATAIRTLKTKTDKAVATGDSLIYREADIPMATRLMEYFPWIYQIPEYHTEIINTFTNNPPTFVVAENLHKNIVMEKFIYDTLQTKYINIYRFNKPSSLFILKNKISKISDDKWQGIEYLHFEKPNIALH